MNTCNACNKKTEFDLFLFKTTRMAKEIKACRTCIDKLEQQCSEPNLLINQKEKK